MEASALFNFEATSGDELHFSKGNILKVGKSRTAISPFIFLSADLSVFCLYVRMSFCLPACQCSVCLSVFLFAYMSVFCQSVCSCVFMLFSSVRRYV